MKQVLFFALGLSLSACSLDATTPAEELETSTDALTYVPGQYEVDSLIGALKAGHFGATTLAKFVDSNAGAYVVHRPGMFDDVRYGKAVDSDPYTWGVAKTELSTFAMTDFYRRAIPRFQCENIFRVTVEDPNTGKKISLATGLKMFVHRWQPGGVQLMAPVSGVLAMRAKYGLDDPNGAAYKKALADAKAFEKNISIKLVVPALIFNKKDALGNWIPSNPGGANGGPVSLYFGRINGAWKLLVANIAEYSCEG